MLNFERWPIRPRNSTGQPKSEPGLTGGQLSDMKGEYVLVTPLSVRNGQPQCGLRLPTGQLGLKTICPSLKHDMLTYFSPFNDHDISTVRHFLTISIPFFPYIIAESNIRKQKSNLGTNCRLTL